MNNLFVGILLVTCVTSTLGQRWSQNMYRTSSKPVTSSGKLGYYSSSNQYSSNTKSSTVPPQVQPSRTPSGIGAWGYIAIMLTVIISGMGAYYFVIFYPIVCKKERMYDVMEMTAV